MFQFARLSLSLPCSKVVNTNYGKGVSPFGNLRIIGCSAPTRSLSQPATSFIVVYYQGIHHILLTVYDTWLFHFICHSFWICIAWASNTLLLSCVIYLLVLCNRTFFLSLYMNCQSSELPIIKTNQPTDKKSLHYSLFSRMILLSRGSASGGSWGLAWFADQATDTQWIPM